MAEQLSFMISGKSNQLSNEKKAIAELEDTVAERIFQVKDMSASLVECSGDFEPMDEFCSVLFSKIYHEDQYVDPSASQMNAAETLALLGTKSTED